MSPAARQAFNTLLAAELRELWYQPRALHAVPVACAGVLWAAWAPPEAGVVLPAAAAVFAALEPQYNNMLAHHAGERDALALFPVPWEAVVLAKNVATIVLTVAASAIALCALGYFSARPVTPAVCADTALLLWTVVFPLLVLGNGISVRRPRRACGMKMEDLYEALLMLVSLALAAVPYAVLPAGALLAYGAAMGLVWLLVSVPGTVRNIAASFASPGGGR